LKTTDSKTVAEVEEQVNPALYYPCKFTERVIDARIGYATWALAFSEGSMRGLGWDATSGENAIKFPAGWKELVVSNS
jgi:hypothetical protein